MTDLKKYPLDSLKLALTQLQESSEDLKPKEWDMLKEIQAEVHERMGQPRGELHLTVIKGDKTDVIDFTLGFSQSEKKNE